MQGELKSGFVDEAYPNTLQVYYDTDTGCPVSYELGGTLAGGTGLTRIKELDTILCDRIAINLSAVTNKSFCGHRAKATGSEFVRFISWPNNPSKAEAFQKCMQAGETGDTFL